MMPLRTVEIVGGGLTGLSLGVALRRAGIPVTLREAGDYPRHRVCGEFIAGLDSETRDRLGLAPFLAGARQHREVAWFRHDEEICRQRLPAPAIALSRHTLDRRLAEAFTSEGGTLLTRTRASLDTAPEGTVFATGRRRTRSAWLGLKLHALDLPLSAGLEVHLGDLAYVGLCAVEGGWVNVSGLFRQRDGLAVTRADALPAYLRAVGLRNLADRIEVANVSCESRCAVAGLGFASAPRASGRFELGDAFAMIPPFTGNGMAMAFQSAAIALGPLAAWAKEGVPWREALEIVDRRVRARFRLRLAWARALHALLFRPAPQRWLAVAARAGLLPLSSLYRVLH